MTTTFLHSPGLSVLGRRSRSWVKRKDGRAGKGACGLGAAPAPHDPGVNNNSSNNGGPDEDQWHDSAFPGYLQNSDESSFCETWQSVFPEAERDSMSGSWSLGESSPVWQAIRREAERDAVSEPLLSSFLYASILAHKSFERALAFVLANRLANPTMLPTQLFEIFLEVLKCSPSVLASSVADVEAVRERDPACRSYSSALLYYKGYHALQVHRIAHALWKRGQRVLAHTLQSSVSEAFSVDIHPAAKIGRGVLIDHGTGVVIGETAVVGANCSILQNVTLGGTGKEIGDRHPKLESNVLVGASATILGNIVIGKGSQVAAGSLVLKSVPAHTMVAGSPAKQVGKVHGNPALSMEHWSRMADSSEDLWQETLKATASRGIPPPSPSLKPEHLSETPPAPPAPATAESSPKPEVAEVEPVKKMPVGKKIPKTQPRVKKSEKTTQLPNPSETLTEPEYFI